MSRAGALAHLAGLRAQLLMQWGGQAGARSVLEQYSRAGFLVFPSNWTKPLAEALSNFLPLHDDLFLSTGRGTSKVDFNHIATASIERMVLGTPEAKIIEDWEALLTDRKGTIVSVMALLGVQAPGRIEIAPGVTLVPPEDVPATREREALFRINRWNEQVFTFDLFQDRRSTPLAALLIETRDFFIIKDGTPGDETRRLFEKISMVTSKALAAMTLSGQCAPVVTWSYDVPVHPAIPANGLGGMGASGTLSPLPVFGAPVDPTTLKDMYVGIGKMGEKDWVPLRLSINRLARSRGHADPIDRAIDLGISIEATLLHREQGTGAKGELRNKVGTRGAWLAADTPADRERVFNVLRAAYDARSAAVHNGVLTPKNAGCLNEADEECTKLLRKIVQSGAFPSSWDKLVLGFGPEAWKPAATADRTADKRNGRSLRKSDGKGHGQL
jgi:hypothetical protein